MSRAVVFSTCMFLAGVSLTLASCAGDSARGTEGAMRQSSTRPRCAPDDAACVDDGLDAPLAVGARLPIEVQITARGVASPKLRFDVARPDVLALEDDVLVGKTPGWSSVLFVGDDGIVLDFVTMAVEAPTRIGVYRLRPSGAVDAAELPERIEVAVGDDFEVAVKASSGAFRLLGDPESRWALDGTSVALQDAGRPSSRRLRALSVGLSTLLVEAGGLRRALALEVRQ